MSPGPPARSVVPVGGPLDASVHVPGSKSLTNRALVAAALARGRSTLLGALFADDTEAMLDCLVRLGIPVEADRPRERILVEGCGGILPDTAAGAPLDARLSGTTARFLLPVLALGSGPITLDGAPQLRTRPMADGIGALRSIGALVVEEGVPGHLPVEVRGLADAEGLGSRSVSAAGPIELGVSGDAGGLGSRSVSAAGPTELSVSGDASSQFLSGLLLAAPALPGGLVVRVVGRLVSRPYVDMTAAVMRSFGATVDVATAADGTRTWTVAPTGYRATTYRVEPDASAASYFFAAAAICGGRVTVAGLGKDRLQGDLAFVDVLEQMGCQVERHPDSTTVAGTGSLVGIDVDLADLSDTAQTLAAVAVFASTPTRIRGIGFIRAKETDRVGNVVRELRRCGVEAGEEDDGFVVQPGTPGPARVETYGDHRMAMSFALLGLRVPGVEIAGPDCVAKTFPGFWDVLDGLRPSPEN